jgi:hypothetical protein
MTEEAELKSEVRHLREVISQACFRLRDLAARGGNGADGHLWQQHNEIERALFAESVWMHRDDREFVPREEFDMIVARMRKLELQLALWKRA